MTMRPSSNEKSVIVVASTPTAIITGGTSNDSMPSMGSVNHNKVKCCNINEISNVFKSIYCIERNSESIGLNKAKLSSQEIILKQSNNHIKKFNRK